VEWPGREDFCDASEQSFDVQPVCAVSGLRPRRGREALLIGLAASGGGLVVASGSGQSIEASAEVMKCRRPGDIVWRV
jgi:hypothetical protein